MTAMELLRGVNELFFLVVTCLLTHDKELFDITGRKKAFYEIVRRLNRNGCTNALLVFFLNAGERVFYKELRIKVWLPGSSEYPEV